MSVTSATLDAPGVVALSKPCTDATVYVQLSGPHQELELLFEGSLDGSCFVPLRAGLYHAAELTTASFRPAAGDAVIWRVPAEGLGHVQVRVLALATGSTAKLVLHTVAQSNVQLLLPLTPVETPRLSPSAPVAQRSVKTAATPE